MHQLIRVLAYLRIKLLKLSMHLTFLIPIKEDLLILNVEYYLILELKAAMVSLGFDSKNAVIFQMISDLDEDGSGVLEFDEWLHLMTSRVNDKDSKNNIGKIFNLFDDEKTGNISVKNLRRVAQDLGEIISEE